MISCQRVLLKYNLSQGLTHLDFHNDIQIDHIMYRITQNKIIYMEFDVTSENSNGGFSRLKNCLSTLGVVLTHLILL